MGARLAHLADAIAAGVLLAMIAAAPAALAAPAEEGVRVPVDCGSTVCVLPRKVWEALVQAHNELVDDKRRLEAEVARRKACRRELEHQSEQAPTSQVLRLPRGRGG